MTGVVTKLTKQQEADAARAEWLAVRRTGLGGSDAAKVLGRSNFGTGADVWDEKTGLVVPENDPKREQLFRLAHLMEPLAGELYCRNSTEVIGQPKKIRRVKIKRHPAYDRLLASFDWLVLDDGVEDTGILDAKTMHPSAYRKMQLRGISNDTVAQMQHYMGFGYPFADVIFLNRGSGEYLVERMLPDHEFIAEVQPFLQRWWTDFVVGNIRPELPPEEAPKLPEIAPGELIALEDIEDEDRRELVAEMVGRLRELDEYAKSYGELAKAQKDALLGELFDSETGLAKGLVAVETVDAIVRLQFGTKPKRLDKRGLTAYLATVANVLATVRSGGNPLVPDAKLIDDFYSGGGTGNPFVRPYWKTQEKQQ